VVLDDKDVFLDDEANSLEEKVVVLSKHVDRRKRKDDCPRDKDE
jgi:hypothetical protein